jgi:hypothetical protein
MGASDDIDKIITPLYLINSITPIRVAKKKKKKICIIFKTDIPFGK